MTARRGQPAGARNAMCRSITLSQARRLPPIPSGYETATVLHLDKHVRDEALSWSLREQKLGSPYAKSYDNGRVDDWLPLYASTTAPETLHFIAASRAGRDVGLLTWANVEWNTTLWLVDIRVLQAYRRVGIGSALISALKNEAKRLDARGISVETQINNVPAVRFYESHGFRIAGFNEALYTNDDLADQDVALFLFWAR